MVNIAVMGYGTVGSGVIEVLQTNKERIDQRAGDEIHVKYILDLRDFPGDPIQEKIVHDFQVIAEDPSIQIVVEVMGGIEPAYTFCEEVPDGRKKRGDLKQSAGGKARCRAAFHCKGEKYQFSV